MTHIFVEVWSFLLGLLDMVHFSPLYSKWKMLFQFYLIHVLLNSGQVRGRSICLGYSHDGRHGVCEWVRADRSDNNNDCRTEREQRAARHL